MVIIIIYFRIVVVSKNYEGKTDLVEEWYGTEYSMEQIPKEQIEVGVTCMNGVSLSHMSMTNLSYRLCLIIVPCQCHLVLSFDIAHFYAICSL